MSISGYLMIYKTIERVARFADLVMTILLSIVQINTTDNF